jgi:hypothetical protein
MRLFFGLPIGIGLLCLALTSNNTTWGAMVGFADQEGPTVLFTDITEINGSPDSSFSLFGGVSTTGNSLDFDAFNMRGEASGGFVSENGRLSLTASSKSGSLISAITVSQSGFGSTFGEAYSNIDLGGSITINGDRSPNASTSFTKTSAAGDGFASEFWEREFVFVFDPTDEVRLDLNNMLFASAGAGSVATLETNGLLIQVDTLPGSTEGPIDVTTVPEPGSALAIACIGALLAVRQRRGSESTSR